MCGIERDNAISQITHDVLLAVGLSLYLPSDLFKGSCFVSLADYFNSALGKQSVTRFPVFPGSFFPGYINVCLSLASSCAFKKKKSYASCLHRADGLIIK